jgi:hypothetical protein
MNNANDLQHGVRALFDEALAVALGEIEEDEMTAPTELEDLIRVESFADAGLLTSDPGIVLRFKGGAEFQLSIVQSKCGEGEQ